MALETPAEGFRDFPRLVDQSTPDYIIGFVGISG
jgi:hypothetical protein